MLQQITQFFRANLNAASATSATERTKTITLATAALLVEVCRAVINALQRQFSLSQGELDQLIELAKAEVNDTASLYPFTRLVNEYYTLAEKLQLVESMWHIAFADGELDKYEDYLIRKITELIHVSHGDFIRCKFKVAAQHQQ
jgi:uncharacterized tellurite resistance protein B-like protein